jgi:hypothetical protein
MPTRSSVLALTAFSSALLCACYACSPVFLPCCRNNLVVTAKDYADYDPTNDYYNYAHQMGYYKFSQPECTISPPGVLLQVGDTSPSGFWITNTNNT